MGLDLKNGNSKYNRSREHLETTNINEGKKKLRLLKKSNKKKTLKKNYKCFSSGKINITNEWNDYKSGGDEEESSRGRSTCRQTELNQFFKEIDKCGVIMSCDLTLNAVGSENKIDDRKNCPGNRFESNKSTCSEGSYSRRKHHKHHKHKHKKKNFVETEEVINAKVNPIFLWVRQENTRIVEVLCEDYDHRNRLRLTKTHLGWRAIPKTKRFAEAIIPKALPKINSNDNNLEPKNLRKLGRRKKIKRRKNKTPKISKDNDNLNGIKECSVALFKNNSMNYQSNFSIVHSEKIENLENQDNQKEVPIPNSEYSSDKKKDDNNHLKESMEVGECDKLNILNLEESILSEHDNEPERNKEQEKLSEEIIIKNANPVEPIKIKSHSEFSLMDLTKQDSDFNERGYENLGELLKDIPVLEFVEKDVLEEVKQNEKSTPTDLTFLKKSENSKVSSTDLLLLPPNISPLITVTPVTRSSEPLAAPTPEVTITPILTSKKSIDLDKQNIILQESLTPSVEIKRSEIKVPSAENKYCVNKMDKKIAKHILENNTGIEISAKKHKQEDEVTLKNILSKQRVQFLKKNPEESSTSCLHDLLSENLHSDPISQLKEVLSNPLLPVPDPLLVPKARLTALVESPATEIPRLLTMHLEKSFEEKQRSYFTDSEVLEVSLSNLQSLLSANTKELGNYQKSLQTFLEWQKYQTELLEAQVLNAKTLSSEITNNSIDFSNSSTLPQMFWLPYLHKFDLKSNQDFIRAMSSMLSCKSQAIPNKLNVPPQINVNQVFQSSPFLTPTSPVDVESHLKTLTMWQEAVMMQQNLQGMQSFCKDLNACTTDFQKAGKAVYSVKKQYSAPNYSTKSCREEQYQSGCNLFPNELQKNQKYRNVLPGGFEKHQKLSEANKKFKYEQQNQFKKVQSGINYQDELFCYTKLNESSLPESAALNLLQDHFEKHSNYFEKDNICTSAKEEIRSNREVTSQLAMRLQQFNTQIQKTKTKREKYSNQSVKLDTGKKEIPKLKVKNLVDPNKSPPKLLKQIPTEHLPMTVEEKRTDQDEEQNHLWNPLFGSNQIRNHSPWHWTTVTVNGE